MSDITTMRTPDAITLVCLDCRETKIFPNKGFGRIGAALFRQDHECER